ncbi:MAG TPA: Fic family protein [Bacilli bacterium]|nr:Fic family protein [Bacilli bacterium]
MRRFDYSFLKTGNIPANLVELFAGIYSLKEKDTSRKSRFGTVYSELEKIAKVQSIKGSNAIEGIVTTDERIHAIVNQNSAPLNHDEQEIAGYRDALNLVHTTFNNLSFNEKTLFDLHRAMLTEAKPDVAGRYKSEDNIIMEIRSDGTKRVRFEPIPATETKEAMEQLILAYMDARDDYGVNQLLLIPCVVLDFLCIHPFSDGNGRMSRLLSLLLLYKNGFDAGKYISFEEQINKNKGYYYEALRKSSIGWHENKNDYFFFVSNFLMTLLSCYRELDKRFATVNSKKINKTSRIEATVSNSLVPISKKEICEILPDISTSTVELVLSKMVKEEKVIKIGQSTNTRYYRK